MESLLDSQIVVLAAVAGVLAVLIGIGVGRWSARRRLAAAVADWQQRLTLAEGARQDADQEVERLAIRVSELDAAAEQARDRAVDTEGAAATGAHRLAEEQQRVAALSAELEALEARNGELLEQIETWRDEVGHLQREQLTAEEHLDRLASDLVASRDRAAELEAGLERAGHGEKAAAQSAAEGAAEAADLRDEVVRLRRVKLEFQQWMQGVAATEEELAHARQRLTEATREDATLRDEIERRDQRIAELEREAEASRMAAAEATTAKTRPVGEPPELLAAPQGRPDDLQRIRGIGRVLHRTLNQLGIHHFRQIAAWTEAEIEWIASHINTFPDRIRRDRWTEQAAALRDSGRRGGFGEPGER
jgi:predicted flap endonuclease-1-like 5' DNA nuclease